MTRKTAIVFAICACLIPGSAAAQGIPDAGPRVQLERVLTENIIPFWYPQCLDGELGGFRLNHDMNGRWLGAAPKALVTQSRTVWFFARLMGSPYGKPEHLEAALHGFRFLAEKMWDPEFGGFYWMVDASGDRAVMENKHLYGQAFALYALSELYRASGRPDVLDLARRTFGLLESRAHDSHFGGYHESFDRSWRPIEDSERSYLGPPHRVKTMNTHLHLMEAFTTFYQVTGDVLVRERLLELITIESSAVVRKALGACTDQHERNWAPLTGPERDVVSYGHDLENVWLLMDACRAAGLNDGPYLDLYRALFDYSVRYGLDREKGGFFYLGPFNQPASNLEKSWWVQAEALVGSLRMFDRTGDPGYRALFEGVLGWILTRQVDWENGDWFAAVAPDGSTGGAKSGPWKSPYHNGRAVLECLQILSAARQP